MTVDPAGQIFYWYLPEATKRNQYVRDEMRLMAFRTVNTTGNR